MRRLIGSRHTPRKGIGRNENAPQYPNCWKDAARDKTLHRPHRDPAEQLRGLLKRVGEPIRCHILTKCSPTRTKSARRK